MADNAIILAGEYRKYQSKVIASAQTIKPGMLVKLTSADELTVHATRGGYAERIVVLEDALQGGIKTDTYTAGTVCDCAIMIPGSESQVILKAGENVVIGDQLVSAGTGKFEKLSSTYIPLCVATEALDLSDSAAVDTLINVRWL